MIKLKIKVTKEILRKSQMCGMHADDAISSNCAIALAVREIFPHAHVTERIEVWNKPFLWGRNGESCIGTIDLPFEAIKFIDDFDNAMPWERTKMKEIEFEVEIPDWFLDTVNIDEVREVLKNSSTLELKEA